jgi:UDPglucose--hexose-1-phosphate uridylyltransferase
MLFDPLSGEPRIIAPERRARLGASSKECPFCAGNEFMSPPEIARIPGEKGAWAARSVPNLYPITAEHEVLVACPRHVTSLRDLTNEEFDNALQLWVKRLEKHDSTDVHATLFVNDGKAAGASLPHSHAQLCVVPLTRQAGERFSRMTQPDCAVCSLVHDEALRIYEAGGFVVSLHPAPMTAGSLVVASTQHDPDVSHLATPPWRQALQVAIAGIPPDSDFNVLVHASPARNVHPIVEVVPRSSVFAGLELSTGVGVSIDDPHTLVPVVRERVGAYKPHDYFLS